MTPQHAQSGGGSAVRAIVLVALAVAAGVFLLARGFDGADDAGTGSTTASGSADNGGASDDGGDGESAENGGTTSTTSSSTTSSTVPPVVTHPAGEVKVAVMNGTGERGRAGRTAESLNAAGHVTTAKNTEQSRVERSAIYYKASYGDDAKAVASVLGAPPNIIAPAPQTIMSLIRDPETPQDLEDFHIFVVVGTDDVIVDPSPPET